MKRILNKYTYLLFFALINVLAFGQPPCPSCPIGGGGSTGANGTGSRASSIDMYAISLAVIAFVFAIYYAKNYMKKIAD